MAPHHPLVKLAENAPGVTYGGATASIALWGLHISEICVIVSTLVSVLGLALQIWLATYRIRRLERGHSHTEAVKAIAKSHRALDAKVETIEKTGD